MKTEIYSKIENATITIIKSRSHGVLIRNQMILTAAHCVNYRLKGEMVLPPQDYIIEEIKTQVGNLRVSPSCIELTKDIAVLGQVDDPELYDDMKLFDEFCTNTPPIKICRNKLEADKKYKILIYSHEKEWITGYAMLYFPESPMLSLEVDKPIKKGTSGSAVINEKGEIIGIVSYTSEQHCTGGASRPLLALPVWVCRKIYRH
jgi:hypothetical protein